MTVKVLDFIKFVCYNIYYILQKYYIKELKMAKEKMSFKKKLFLIIDCVLLAIIFILCLFVYIWYKGDSYEDFESFTERFEIPALDDGVVPQGLANYGDDFFTSNYMVDGSASRVYYVDGGDEEKYVTFTYNGEVYAGHCGGIATDGSRFWLCSDNYIYTASYSDVVSTASADGGAVEFTSRVTLEVNAAYLFYDNDCLYVGEFYREQNYQTDESHHLTTPNGDENNALALVYEIASTASGIAENPVYAFSTTERIQGFAVVDGKICLSQSYGLSKSHILVYDGSAAKIGATGTISIGGNNVTLYYLDGSNLVNDYSIPCMSEGLCVYDGEVYVLFESAGRKYKYYVRERVYNVYSFVPVAE